MSIVSNYSYTNEKEIRYEGDYLSHKGDPSLLRSDSMLKAIGKAINIRVSGYASSSIPIIILGNSPITESYQQKVDFLKSSGVIQEFWSLHPNPTEALHITSTPQLGFQTLFDEDNLKKECKGLLELDMNYFSTMLPRAKLGQYIRSACAEKTDRAKAEKFLKLIRS